MKTLRYTAPMLAMLLCNPSLLCAQTPDPSTPAPRFEEALPITVPLELEPGLKNQRIELQIHRWSDQGSQDEAGQQFSVTLSEQPSFVHNIRWQNGPELTFAPGEHSKVVALLFDTGEGAQPGEETELVFTISAHHKAVVPPERELRIALQMPRAPVVEQAHVSVCALRPDTPESFAIENAVDYCDPNLAVLKYDRIVLFFTPERDLSEPIGEPQAFAWRLLNPNGETGYYSTGAFSEFYNRGSDEAPDLSIPFTKPGSPGRFAIELDLWDIHDSTDPAQARMGPGTYTLEVSDVHFEPTGAFGQGESKPYATNEWVVVGSFEIAAPKIEFQTFIVEQVKDLPMAAHSEVDSGTLTIGDPQISGSSVSVEMRAEWRPVDRLVAGGVPALRRSSSRMTVKFPEQIWPGHRLMGEVSMFMEQLEKEHLYFTSGLHLPVATNQLPPDRYLIDQFSPVKPLCQKDYAGPDKGCIRKTPEYDDMSDASWVWAPGVETSDYWYEVGRGEVVFNFIRDDEDLPFGRPERRLAEQLRDPNTIWVVPAFYSLVNTPRPTTQGRYNMRSYGYAIYGTAPYSGPLPTGRPEAGPSGGGGSGSGGTGSGSGDTDTAGGDGSTGSDSGVTGGESTGGGVGSGIGIDSGQDTALTPPAGGSLNPTDPNIAALIAEWVAAAEPPENALFGSELRYNQWGVVHGRTADGIITTGAPPDDVSGRSSPEYLWGLKDRLDSVDHCTLGEYVGHRLAGTGYATCEGRYQGKLEDLQGRSSQAARAKVEKMRWVAVIMKGDPAPSAELAGTVQRQEPPPNTRQRRGETVELWIYGEPRLVGIEVPELVGRAKRLAVAWLEDLGLVAVVQRGNPAPSPELEGKVETQDPAAGQHLKAGDAVVLRIYRATSGSATGGGQINGLDCSRWPGSVPIQDPATGESVCECASGMRWNASGTGCVASPTRQQCPTGSHWDGPRQRCVADDVTVVKPILPELPSGCAHMPGTIASNDRCICPGEGHWDESQRRCVHDALTPLEPRICIQYYADIRLAKITGDATKAAAAEAAAREAGCGADNISDAIASGDAWGGVSQGISGNPGAQTVVTSSGPCNKRQKHGGDNPVRHTVNLGTAIGSFVFEYETFTVKDRMTITQGGVPLFDSGCVGTNGIQQVRVNLRGSGTNITVNVQPRCDGESSTAWEFVVGCP